MALRLCLTPRKTARARTSRWVSAKTPSGEDTQRRTSAQVDPDGAVPVIDVKVDDVGAREANARTLHADVDPPESLDRLPDVRLGGRFLGDVAADGEDSCGVCFGEREGRDGRREGVLLEVDEGDARCASREESLGASSPGEHAHLCGGANRGHLHCREPDATRSTLRRSDVGDGQRTSRSPRRRAQGMDDSAP